jgi:predicted LPLAT superfamily acyltransferase
MSSWEGKTRGGVLGYRIFVWTLKHLGISFGYFLLYFVVTYFVFSSRKAIKSISFYFRQILEFSRLQTAGAIFRNYYIFGQILLDRIAMLAGFQERFTFDFDGEEHLRQMDRGGLLISAHVGNWEVAGNLLKRLEKKIHILLFDAEHQRIKGYMSEVLTNRSVGYIVIREDFSHLFAIRDALSKGEIIAMHGDRFIEGNRTIPVRFMGMPALFPTGPVNMAAKFGVPVSYVFAVKENRKHYHFYATPLLHIDYPGNIRSRERSLRSAVEKYVEALEKILRKYPFQWFNYYDFWQLPETVKVTGHAQG